MLTGLAASVPTDNKATDWTSHANRPQDSKVPHFVQEVAPKAVEEALPESESLHLLSEAI
jgi:hypothetical protein